MNCTDLERQAAQNILDRTYRGQYRRVVRDVLEYVDDGHERVLVVFGNDVMDAMWLSVKVFGPELRRITPDPDVEVLSVVATEQSSGTLTTMPRQVLRPIKYIRLTPMFSTAVLPLEQALLTENIACEVQTIKKGTLPVTLIVDLTEQESWFSVAETVMRVALLSQASITIDVVRVGI